MWLYEDVSTGSADYSTQRSLQKTPPYEYMMIWFNP